MDPLHQEKRRDLGLGKYAPQLDAEALHVPRPEPRRERRRDNRRREREQEIRGERPVVQLGERRPRIVGQEERPSDGDPRDQAGAGRERGDVTEKGGRILRTSPFPITK